MPYDPKNHIITFNINRQDLVMLNGHKYTRILRIMNGTSVFYYIDEESGKILDSKVSIKLENKYSTLVNLIKNQN